MIKKVFKAVGAFLGSTIIASGLYWQALNLNIPKVEKYVTRSKTVPTQVLSKKPKRILYLASSDFEADYDAINNKFKSKLEHYYRMKKETKQILQENTEKLESMVKSFNLEKDSYNTHLGDLNLIEEKTNQPFIVRENTKEQEVYMVKFSNKKEFFNALLNEKGKSLDEVIIFCHGCKAFINSDVPMMFFKQPSISKIVKLLNPNNYITTLTVRLMPEEKVNAIRSKLSDEGIVYLLSCKSLDNSDDQTTIGEAFAYLFGKPVVASKITNKGWPADAHPYDKIDFSKPETLKEENVSYKMNFLNGDWYAVSPKR